MAAAERRSPMCLRCGTDAGDEPELVQAGRIHHVLDQEIPRLIDVLMQDKVLRLARCKASAGRSCDLREIDGVTVEAHWRDPHTHPGCRRSGLRLLAHHGIGHAAERTFGRIRGVRGTPVAAPHKGGGDIGELTDENHIERIALRPAVRVSGAAGKTLQRGTQRDQVVIILDLGTLMLEQAFGKPFFPGIVRHPQEERERDQRLSLQQIDIQQPRSALRVDEQHARFRFAWQDGILEPQLVQVCIDARVRCRGE
ncbi:hypothetical protein D3C73_677640 [compost metagenome]